jgi:hypothetical protein
MPATRLRPLLALALGLLLPAAGCGQDDPRPVPPSVAEAFAELPLPPNPSYLGRSGGEGALTISLRSGHPYEVVLDYYRKTLAVEPWRIRSDARDGGSGRVIYAEHDGRPLWVRLRPEGTAWTLVELTGAVARRGTDSLRARRDSAATADSAVADTTP